MVKKIIYKIILLSIINSIVFAQENNIQHRESSAYIVMLNELPEEVSFHNIEELTFRSSQAWNAISPHYRYTENLFGQSIYQFVELKDYLNASSNLILENRAQGLYEIYPSMSLRQIKIEDKELVLFLMKDWVIYKDLIAYFVDIYATYAVITHRYNSYITPWNWTDGMKKAYEQIKELYDKIKDEELFKQLKKVVDEKRIIIGKHLINYKK